MNVIIHFSAENQCYSSSRSRDMRWNVLVDHLVAILDFFQKTQQIVSTNPRTQIRDIIIHDPAKSNVIAAV